MPTVEPSEFKKGSRRRAVADFGAKNASLGYALSKDPGAKVARHYDDTIRT